MRGLAVVLAVLAVSGCRSRDTSTNAASAIATDAAPARDPHVLVTDNCVSCHGEDMLVQQRLTPAQWTKVVKKMVGWGALVAPADEPALAAYLAAKYGPDADPYRPPMIDAAVASAQLAVHDDGPFAGGDAERGGAVFSAQCASCHGADGRGGIGVNLVDRPLLGHAAEIAATIRTGRGKMPPLPSMSDAQIADLVAHLRRLSHPQPI